MIIAEWTNRAPAIPKAIADGSGSLGSTVGKGAGGRGLLPPSTLHPVALASLPMSTRMHLGG
jgi:hypothetical protein